jgi:hypothetical protein
MREREKKGGGGNKIPKTSITVPCEFACTITHTSPPIHASLRKIFEHAHPKALKEKIQKKPTSPFLAISPASPSNLSFSKKIHKMLTPKSIEEKYNKSIKGGRG